MDVLVIRFSSLGDVILASAAVEALKRLYPSANIHFLTKRAYEQVFSADERVSHLISIGGHESPWAIVKWFSIRRYDLIVDLHRSLRSIGVASLLHAPKKLHVRKRAIARRFMVASRNRYRRRFDALGSYLETLAPVGFEGRILPRIIPDMHSVGKAEQLLGTCRGRGTGKIVGIAPGARHATKRWNEKSFARLADELIKRGDVPVFLGDEEDNGMIGRIDALMEHTAWSLAGELTLAGTIGLVSRLDAVVTNDSGPMHIAGALGIPFVAVFGPTHPDLGFCPGYPRGAVLTTGESCSPCSLHGAAPCRMPSRRCMDGITWEMVRDKLCAVMGE